MKHINKLFLLTSLFMLTYTMSAFSQEQTKTSFKDKLYTGGYFGLTIGSYTNVMVSPLIGARFTDKIYAGLGIEYNYTKDKRYTPALTYNQYGGRVFGQYNFLPQLFAHVEFNGMSLEYYDRGLQAQTRSFVPFIYVGGGYRQYISERSFISFRVLFDVLQHKNSPYKAWDPNFSIGFGVGI